MKPFIKGIEYNEAAKTLTVRFQTSTYIYHGVPPEHGKAIDNIFQSSELEHVFNEHIEGKYRSERITA